MVRVASNTVTSFAQLFFPPFEPIIARGFFCFPSSPSWFRFFFRGFGAIFESVDSDFRTNQAESTRAFF